MLFAASCSNSTSAEAEEPDAAPITNFSLAANGLTIICEDASPGDLGTVNGVTYEAVDNDLLRARRDEDADLTNLCTTRVTDMSDLFSGSESGSFNQDISRWDTGNVTDMSAMFKGATAFNQDISSWDVKNVTNMNGMFSGATSFNQNLSRWCVEELTAEPTNFDLEAESWQQPRPHWGESCTFSLAENGVTILCPDAAPGETGFVEAIQYEAVDNALLRTRRNDDADLSTVCTSLVTDMSRLFRETSFNQDISGWDTGNVTDMSFMFVSAVSFNQDISKWDTRNVTDMNSMFLSADTFNQDISKWKTRNVADMKSMFFSSDAFNQDLSGWCVENISQKPLRFDLEAESWTLPRPNWGEPC